jgi:penicillin amidase
MIIDLDNLDDSIFVNSTGQTENLWHPNRKDAIPLWFTHQYYQMNFTKEKVTAAKRHELSLVP